MKWTPLKIVSGMFLLAFCSLFGSSISVFATDYTFNFDSSNPTSQNMCHNPGVVADTPLCSDIKTIIISTEGTINTNLRPNIVYDNSVNQDCSASGNSNLQIPFWFNSTWAVSDIHICGFSFGSSYSWNSSNATATITLSTEELSTGTSSCPEPEEPEPCPECQVCPAIPENPYDQKLDAIKVAIYVVAGTMLVIYFFYCIYRIIIKAGKK